MKHHSQVELAGAARHEVVQKMWGTAATFSVSNLKGHSRSIGVKLLLDLLTSALSSHQLLQLLSTVLCAVIHANRCALHTSTAHQDEVCLSASRQSLQKALVRP